MVMPSGNRFETAILACGKTTDKMCFVFPYRPSLELTTCLLVLAHYIWLSICRLFFFSLFFFIFSVFHAHFLSTNKYCTRTNSESLRFNYISQLISFGWAQENFCLNLVHANDHNDDCLFRSKCKTLHRHLQRPSYR